MGSDETFKPDFLAYHKTHRNELESVKNRVRTLIQHWATDGAFKEAALRTVLRRYLPESFFVGTGFVVTQDGCTTQIDILIVDRASPTLFKDGDLLIVTPEVVRGIIEVKTTLTGPKEIDDACQKLSDILALCYHHRNKDRRLLWAGLFVYDGDTTQSRNLLSGVCKAYERIPCPIGGIGYGSDTLLHFGERVQLAKDRIEQNCWAIWDAPEMAASYFVGLMLNHWFNVAQYSQPIAWLPGQAENRPRYYATTADAKNIIELRE